MSANPEITFEVQIQGLEGLPPRPIIRSLAKRRWRATLNAGIVLERTTAVGRGSNGLVVWNETFTFTTTKDRSSANIALYRANEGSNDEKVAEIKDLDLIEVSKAKTFTANLLDTELGKRSYGRLSIKSQIKLPQAVLTLTKMNGQPFFGQIGKVSSVPQSWQRFLSAFQQAVELARQISELNGTAKAAVGTISFALAAVVKQIERDERVDELQELMSSLLLFFQDVRSLQQNPFLRDALDRLLVQVSDCTYFIVQYREIESFIQRTAVHITSDTDTVLNQFFAVFTTLRSDLALGISLQATINTEYILNKVEDIDIFLHINRLRHLEGSGWRTDKGCAPNTREFTLHHIHRWISSLEPGLFRLVGPPGSGKSAILHTLARTLSETRRLGACVFLNEYTRGEKTADTVMRSLLYYLALSNGSLGKKIATVIKDSPAIDSVDAAYYKIILKNVSQNLVLSGPLVVIVDGVDELGGPKDQELLETLLGKIASATHNQLRFILSTTARPSAMEQGSICWEIIPFINRPSNYASGITNQDGLNTVDGQLLVHALAMERLERLMTGYTVDNWTWFETQYQSVMSEVVNSLAEGLSAQSALLRDVIPALDCDFYHCISGSKLFVNSEPPNTLLYGFGFLRKMSESRLIHMNEYDIDVPSIISELLGPTNPPSLPTDSPLNIYQIRLRDALEDGQGPVYARIALPVSEPLVAGKDIKDGFMRLGCGVMANDFNNMSAKSPPEGCEWIILHRKLFKSETKDGYTSVMATTPAMTQAILERLVCIWVDWDRYNAAAHCIRLRDGKKETGFLDVDSFTKAVYQGTHTGLSDRGKKRGDLRPGDQLQVRARYREDEDEDEKWAVIAIALKY